VKRKAVVLLSGGVDSATTLFMARKRGYKCLPLIIDYGQRNNREIETAKKIARWCGCAHIIVKLPLPWKGSSLLDRARKLPKGKKRKTVPSTYVPARNTMMLSMALSYAESVGASAIFIGAHTEDYSGYPDCRPRFFEAFGKVKDMGTKIGRKIKIMTPLLGKKKSEIIKTGVKLGVPYKLTWSCYEGGQQPCGACDSCYYRSKGFNEAGIKDPWT